MIEYAKYFACCRIPDDDLTHLRKVVTIKLFDVAPTFAMWLRLWCEVEEVWRRKDPENRPEKHAVALPPCDGWSNRELGQALRGVTYLSYVDNIHVTVGELVDRLALCVSEHAASRLEKA